VIKIIRPSDDSNFMARFCELPEKLGHNNLRPLPKKEYWGYLLSVFPEVNKELFIVAENGKDVGRILVNTSAGNPGVAFFGMFECEINNKLIAKELFSAAETWAKEQEASSVIGPVDINVWFGNRFQTDGFEKQYAWAPTNPIEYYEFALSCGYIQDQGYSSKFFDTLGAQVERTKVGYDLAVSEGYSFRHLDLDSEYDTNRLYELNIDSFRVNYLYEPITREQYFKTHIQFIKGSDLSLSYFIVDKENIPRGYVYCFIEDDCLIVKSMLIQREYQGAKLSSAVTHRACLEAYNRGYRKGAGVLVRDGNVSDKLREKIGGPYLVQRYHMVKKEL